MLSRRGFFGVTLGAAVAATVVHDIAPATTPEPTPLRTAVRVWPGVHRDGLNLATVIAYDTIPAGTPLALSEDGRFFVPAGPRPAPIVGFASGDGKVLLIRPS